MPVDVNKIKESLVESGIIEEKDFDRVAGGIRDVEFLEKALVNEGLISYDNLGKLIADISGYPYVNLKKEKPAPDVLNTIPELVARKQKAIAFRREGNKLHLAMNNPENLPFIYLLEKKTGEEIVPHYTTAFDIEDGLGAYQSEMMEKIKQRREEMGEKGKFEIDENYIIKLVDDILDFAYKNNASDIHIEPYEDKTVVRYRIDGILHDVMDIQKKFHEPVVNRVKVLSRLRTDEHLAAQDGKIQKKIAGQKVDLRVSVIPIINGEKVVMRLLSERGRQFSLESLGLRLMDLKKVKRAISKPYGMILATGPTGSGKTTTLYAVLKILNTRAVNISTIEDPVEYDIAGVNQIQVNPKTNLTFSDGLRSIVRQDPDIIMVGEIRDEETAGIAVNAAMTGHLVLSTLHTNDAATALPRLLDMYIESFLVASTVNVIIAQRLVRRICEKCIFSEKIDRETIIKNISGPFAEKHLGKKKTINVYHGKGCPLCNGTGYRGRVGIFEVMEIDEDIRQLIMKRSNADEIKSKAIEKGMSSIIDDGMAKVMEGITTLEEVLRVAKE